MILSARAKRASGPSLQTGSDETSLSGSVSRTGLGRVHGKRDRAVGEVQSADLGSGRRKRITHDPGMGDDTVLGLVAHSRRRIGRQRQRRRYRAGVVDVDRVDRQAQSSGE
jgi:hypothetical protein